MSQGHKEYITLIETGRIQIGTLYCTHRYNKCIQSCAKYAVIVCETLLPHTSSALRLCKTTTIRTRNDLMRDVVVDDDVAHREIVYKAAALYALHKTFASASDARLMRCLCVCVYKWICRVHMCTPHLISTPLCACVFAFCVCVCVRFVWERYPKCHVRVIGQIYTVCGVSSEHSPPLLGERTPTDGTHTHAPHSVVFTLVRPGRSRVRGAW